MRQKNHIIRRLVVLVATLASLFAAGVAPAASTAPVAAPSDGDQGVGPDPVTGSYPGAPGSPVSPGSAASPGPQGSAGQGLPPGLPGQSQGGMPGLGQPQGVPGQGQGQGVPGQGQGVLGQPQSVPGQGQGTGPAADGLTAPRNGAGTAAGSVARTDAADAALGRAHRPATQGTTGDPRAMGARVFEGQGFDTCQAPSVATMNAWRQSSPYRAVGIYFGGHGRGCSQPNLTRAWVEQVSRMGWNLIPTYVGSQAPCVGSKHKRKAAMSHHEPYARGAKEGQDAVSKAQALGMKPRSALYLDMEAYDRGNTRCADTTLRFIKGWNRAVSGAGYLPGFYSSANSGIAHLEQARAAGHGDLPAAMWFARWNVPASVDGESRMNREAWQPHRRIHQFEGNVKRKHGGRTLHIDRNLVDAPVAIVE
ncbi:glycoside hydrolase domain-containing protein [Streptomyces sp. NPDC054796]